MRQKTDSSIGSFRDEGDLTMAMLNSKFDILRGWPREGSLDESLPIKASETVISGEVVQYDAGGADPGAITAATTPNRAAANSKQVFVVIEGNDDFSAQYVKKAVVLRDNAVFRLDPDNFTYNAGMVPGAPLSFSSGLWIIAAAGNQIIGTVERDDTSVDGTIVVRFQNTGEAKL